MVARPRAVGLNVGVDELWLVRHGETAWSAEGRHTSRTDVPLEPRGEEVARALAERLADVGFALVLTSPRQRARRTAELAGFPEAEVCEDLVEWDYGDYEGITTAEIRETVPGWTVWSHPTPGGETAAQVAARLDRVLDRVRDVDGAVLLVAHSHSLRALAARWLGLDVAGGRYFTLDTATVSVLAHERETPVIRHWNC
jgi:probable phosphoglycerate mutase